MMKLFPDLHVLLHHSIPGVLPYMRYMDMCSPKRYGALVVLLINRVLILADFGHK